MNILLIDSDTVGLNFALRCKWAGHNVKVWQPPSLGTGDRCDIGDGMIERVLAWQSFLVWAELILVTTNSRYAAELEPLYQKGYPIIGTNRASAALELDRTIGQEILQECGIETLEFEEFSNYDKAIEFVKRERKVYVSKPWGGASDKSLSYVPKSAEDLVCRLQRWKAEGVKGKFILQEKIDGTEMAAGAWFGPGGFSKAINETWEEKRFMNGGYGPNCYSADTEVLTKRGWLTFDEVKLTDLIASYDPLTRNIFFEMPTKIYWTDYEGDMISFRNRYVDLLVTPTHQMWAARRKTNSWHFYNADACPSEFDILQTGYTAERSWGDVVIPAIEKYPEVRISADIWIAFMGLYLSEGYIDERGRIHICQCPGSKKEAMRVMLDDTGLKFHEYENKWTSTPDYQQIAEYLRTFGHSREKFVPSDIKNASSSQLHIFLAAFCLGDGDSHEGRRRYTSGSYRMISDLQEMMLRIGKTGVISMDKRTMMVSPINGKEYEAQPVYSIEEATREKVSIRESERIHYSGKIGCVALPTTHLLFIRRNECVAISGNTGEMGTVLRYTKESALFEQVVRPLEEKLHELKFIGNVDVSCMIDTKGRPHPMEFTMRFGWPAFNLMLSLHKGDPAEWLADLLVGKDSLECYDDLCCGVLMTLGDYPWEKWPHTLVEGWPIRGLDSAEVFYSTALTSAKLGKAPILVGNKIVEGECIVTAGEYVLVAMGHGRTVEAARKAAYKVVDQISWPPHTNVRTDIGCRLEKDLRDLHRLGYALDVNYGN